MVEINENGVYVGSAVQKASAFVKGLGEVEFRFVQDEELWRGSLSISYSNWGQASPITKSSKTFFKLKSLLDSLFSQLEAKIPEKEFKRFKKILDDELPCEKKGQLDLFSD